MIQSVLFSIDKWSALDAINWLIAHGLHHNKIDIKDKYIRFRQFAPRKSYKYYTKKLNNGINLIIKI